MQVGIVFRQLFTAARNGDNAKVSEILLRRSATVVKLC